MSTEFIRAEAVEYANSITDDETLQDIIYLSYLEGYTKATKDYTESIRSIRKMVGDNK